jgi:DNA-binding transcriptional MocR family regulator
MTDDQLAAEVARLEAEADRLRGLGLSLDMTRGKPCPDQINLSKPMFDLFDHDSDLTDGGFDAGNYGCPQGLPSARRFFGEMLGVDPDLVFIGGCSSLNIMFDIVTHCFTHGLRGNTPWSELPEVKFLCPSPGYDRHFGVSEYFGFTNVAIPMHEDGPDMDEVERLVEGDPTVKGIWCVPKYQNPMGITFSDEVVRRFAALRPAAPDFRVFWDNAYGVHDFNDTPDQLLNIFEAMREAGTDDLVFEFASTSKVTFPGSGMGCVVCNAEDLADIRSGIAAERVCDNKLSQLMSIRFIPDMAALKEHMAKQAEIVRPHFELVEKKLSEGLADVEGVRWTHPNGGYFVSFDGPEGTAKAIVGLAADLGVKMTGAGATWPYHHDPADSNIRIAPTYPPIEDLDQALDVFVTCVRLVCAQRELQRRNR